MVMRHCPPRVPSRYGRLAATLFLLMSSGEGQAADDYSGTYVLMQQTTLITELPVVADVVARSRAISIQNLQHDGASLKGSGELCDVQLESSSSLVRTILPDAFKRALPPVITDATLTRKGSSVLFHQPEQTIVVGARLKDPVHDPLPISAKDARVYDQDGDGHPGMTVRVEGIVEGEIRLVQRSRSSFRGAKRGNAFTGRITFDNEQRILTATSRFLKDSPNSRPAPQRSYFRFEKVPSDFDCARARQLAASWR